MEKDYFRDYETGFESFYDAASRLESLELVLDEVGAPQMAYDYLDRAVGMIREIATMYDSLQESRISESGNYVSNTIDRLRGLKKNLETSDANWESWESEYRSYRREVDKFSAYVSHLKNPAPLQKIVDELEDVDREHHDSLSKSGSENETVQSRGGSRRIFDSILRIPR